MKLERYLLLICLCLPSVFVKAQCPMLADFLDGGTFNWGGPGPCNIVVSSSVSTTGAINLTGDFTLTGVGVLTLATDVTFTGGTFDIQGSAGSLTIGNGTTGSLTVASGTVLLNDGATGALSIRGNSFLTLNSGTTLQSASGITVLANGVINNSGTISNAATNTVISGTLNNLNGGSVTAGTSFTINSGGTINSASGSTLAATGTTTVNGALNLSGTLTSMGNVSVSSTGTLGIASTGSIVSSGGSFAVSASGNVTNDGSVSVRNAITVGGTINNSGTFQTTNSTITVSGTLNTTGQILTTNSPGGGLTVNATGTLLVDAGGAISARTIQVASGGSATVNSSGQITTVGTGDNTINGSLTNHGTLNLGGDLVIDGASAIVLTTIGSSTTINRSGGDGDLEVTNSGTFTMTGGSLSVQDDITTWEDGNVSESSGNFNIAGTVTVGDDLLLTGGNFLNNGIVTINDDIDISLGANFTSSVPGTVLTIVDAYADANCPYADGVYHYCACVADPPDGDGSVLCASALPIELLSFSGSQNGTAIQLDWTTATETNNDFFTIEKLKPNDTFEEVVRIPGAGTSLLTQAYSAVDPNPTIGKNYYRLKQTDYDRKTSHSELIKVVFESNTFIVQVYPNPVTDKNVTVFVHGMQSNESIALELKNTFSQIIYSHLTQANASGTAEVALLLPPLSTGVYIISVNGKSQKILVR